MGKRTDTPTAIVAALFARLNLCPIALTIFVHERVYCYSSRVKSKCLL